MARARRFHEETLSLRSARREAHEFEWVEYDFDGGTFAPSNLTGGGAPSAEAGGSIAFEVQSVDEMVEQLRVKGVRVKLEPFSTPVCRCAIILDSEGNAITLH
jgi:predicted enzyme related to lactoylglutathione lyase